MTTSAEPSTPSGSSATQQRRRQITSYKNTTSSPATNSRPNVGLGSSSGPAGRLLLTRGKPNSTARHQKLSTEFLTGAKMPRLIGGTSGGNRMLKDFSWRNVGVFFVGLVAASFLVLGGVILAVDGLLLAGL